MTYPVIDTDVHSFALPLSPHISKYVARRWVDHMRMVGTQMSTRGGGERPRQRQFAHRTDSMPPNGGLPGTDPAFATEQLLDAYGMSAAMLNDVVPATMLTGSDRYPRELTFELTRAYNEWRKEWFEHDPRWYASINVPFEAPEAAVREIERCRGEARYRDHWAQVLFCGGSDQPFGNPKYWPIYEACEAEGIPVGIHAAGGKRGSACGWTNFYFEDHTGMALVDFPIVASFIFEGVFDRFPKLQVALLELGWSWVPPYAWRLDACHRVMGAEVPHLQRKPSEYLREHFWLTTQPMEEPEDPAWLAGLYELIEAFGLDDRLMFSTDYPHWDFDPPEAVDSMPATMRRKILGENASELYGIPLLAEVAT